jgi:uncharacterized protein YbjT (DUF2867 family)
MSSHRRLLIAGATGKQGGAVISALLARPPREPFHLVALTRNAKSARAQALARKPNVTVIEGNLNDCNAIFRESASPFHGVFSVQLPVKVKVEEEQGKSLVDSAAANGVRHFVYTSADRGGPLRSDMDGTPVEHFRSKFNIENHLKAVAKETDGRMAWTIIRPVAFMENMTPGFLGKAFVSMWRLNGMDRKLQLVSSTDVGMLAAEAFKTPEEYNSKAISLATDEISPREAAEIFERVVGKEIPSTYPFVGRLIKILLKQQLGVMFQWFKEEGFGADPKEFTRKYAEMQNFEQWLRYRSGFVPHTEALGQAEKV